MEQWDRDFIGLVEPGFISFAKGGRGEIRFGAVSLNLDWETGHDGKAEFSFEGFDELDEVSGRGWAKTIAGRLTGAIRFHQGEKSGFTATPWSRAKEPRRKHRPAS
jgi:hypothetical protein